MSNYIGPLIDDKNPLYCPTIPAALYLQSLRQKTQKLSRSPNNNHSPSSSFGQLLERCSHEKDSDYGVNTIGSDWILGDYFTSGKGWFSSQSPGQEDLPPYSPVDSARPHPTITLRHSNRKPNRFTVSSVSAAGRSLKRKNAFSDLVAPPKYARSIPSVHDSSFDVEVRREQLRFSGVDTSPRDDSPNSMLAVSPPKTHVDRLLGRLVLALPGIRLEERLLSLQINSIQGLMDFLAENGYIKQTILEIFSNSDVQRIILAPSMFDENGLNICGKDIYSVFGRDGCFRSLSELSFTGIHIRDSDIRHIHHLPNLATLLLGETGVTNEAVFLLVSLKRTLMRLSLATNPDINNDAVPAIILLSKLSFLSIIDTSIEMTGLRRLAEMMQKDTRNMDIEIPFACEGYFENINTRYLYMPLPPLITNPDACSQLSLAALKRNLEAHAACNAAIVPSGTRPEMVQRLYDILKIRMLDVLVMSMLEGDELN